VIKEANIKVNWAENSGHESARRNRFMAQGLRGGTNRWPPQAAFIASPRLSEAIASSTVCTSPKIE